MQSVYFLPVEGRVTAGEELSLTVCHDDYSLWYSLQSHRYNSSETKYYKLSNDMTQRGWDIIITSILFCGLYVTVEDNCCSTGMPHYQLI